MKTTPIIACLTQPRYDAFLGKLSGYSDILAVIQRVDPSALYTGLVEQINTSQAEILLTGWGATPLPESFMQDCPTIRYICHLTGEVRWLLPRTLIEGGLLVTNWGPAISDSVAEGAFFLLLACLRRATHVVMTMHVKHGWELGLEPPASLLDKRVGMHGFGNIARQLTLLLKPFRCAVSAYSPPVPDEIFEAFSVARETSLEGLFEKNDVIVELEALTSSTQGMVDKHLLERIRPGGVFVNTGRGKVVCEEELAEVAAQGKIFVGLDVYCQEPLPPDSPLRGMENVFLTPHYAGPTPDRLSICAEYALANILAYQQGKPLQSIISLAQYDRIT